MGFRKKAQGSGITWFFVIIVLFIILVIYIISVLFIARGIKPDANIGKHAEYSEDKLDFASTELLISFLNSEINFNSEKIKIKNLIADKELNDNTKIYFEKFQEETEKFMDTNFPLKDTTTIEKTFTDYSGYRTFWLRIYDKDEKIYAYPDKEDQNTWKPTLAHPLEYQKVIVNRYIPTPLGSRHYCDPENEKSIFTYIFISPDKKIALCAEPY